MERNLKVLIGIQARTNNSRLPKKAFEIIGKKRLLDHVIDACQRAAKYSNKFTYKKKYKVDCALLVPYGDPIKDAFGEIDVIEGEELDVLSRYTKAMEIYEPDFICRVTGDCPLIPSYVISKHISIAVVCGYDYVSNVDEECRLSLDGIDCEIISKKMMRWLESEASSKEEREHVTLKARTDPPHWAKRAFTASYFDHSNIKLSVDTEEDLERVREEYDRVGKALQRAERLYGHNSIHRF